MSLRSLAAMHRHDAMSTQLLGEEVVWLVDGQAPVAINAIWIEAHTDDRNPWGIGMEASTSHASLNISANDCPGLTRADHFRRVATGELWQIEQMVTVAGMGYTLTLSRAAEARVRGMR